MKPGVSVQPPPVQTAAKTIGEHVIEWLFNAAKAAAEQERLRKADRREIEESQKEHRERLREKHLSFW